MVCMNIYNNSYILMHYLALFSVFHKDFLTVETGKRICNCIYSKRCWAIYFQIMQTIQAWFIILSLQSSSTTVVQCLADNLAKSRNLTKYMNFKAHFIFFDCEKEKLYIFFYNSRNDV